MKQELEQLLTYFLNDKLPAPEFSLRYLRFWKKVRDTQWEALKDQPALHQRYLNLVGHPHTNDKFKKEWQEVWSQVEVEINPVSKVSDIVADLFTTNEMFSDGTIDGDEFRRQVQAQFDKLQKISLTTTP